MGSGYGGTDLRLGQRHTTAHSLRRAAMSCSIELPNNDPEAQVHTIVRVHTKQHLCGLT